jgi:Protein of unknown function (DUF3455)
MEDAMFTISKNVARVGSLSIVVSLGVAACGGAPEGTAGEALTGLSPSASVDLASRRFPPPLPSPTLAVPAGNELEFGYPAVGVQIYACQATSTTFAWVFQAPEANLFDRRGRVVAAHFAGPTWEAKDGSKVVGAKIAAFTVDPSAIPWLLLQAASHSGDGRMSEVSYIQRLETRGGVAPATGCDASHVGDIARVDYTATYFFYESDDGG